MNHPSVASAERATHCEGAHSQNYALRHDELGPGGYYPASVLLGVLQEAAIDGSASRGFPLTYYHRQRAFWMLRRITFRYQRPLTYGEPLIVTTWVSRVGKTSPTREYRMATADDECIARARTYWVYIDMSAGRSKEIPEELRAGFAPTDEPLSPLLDVPSGPLDLSGPTWTESRTTTLADVDWSGHVKCCRYVSWLEDLLGQACVSVGENSGEASFASFDLQLLAATAAAERVRLVAQPAAAWKVDVRNAAEQVVARAALWPQRVNAQRTAFCVPDAELLQRLGRGP